MLYKAQGLLVNLMLGFWVLMVIVRAISGLGILILIAVVPLLVTVAALVNLIPLQ
jgi:hypothetical protein